MIVHPYMACRAGKVDVIYASWQMDLRIGILRTVYQGLFVFRPFEIFQAPFRAIAETRKNHGNVVYGSQACS